MSYSAQAGWPEVRIGDVLTYLDERIDLDDAAEYITITVKRRHGGLEEREHLFGHQIQTKKQFRLIPGAFIMSRIQCWHQAYAIVPDVVPPNMIASSNYDEFAVSPEVDKRFFWWLSHSPYFTETVRSSAFGVVIEKMVFNRETWLEKKIPLPLLAEQRRIVARIEELAAKVEEACRLRGQATGDASGLLLSELHRRFVTEENTWPRSTVSQCAEIIDPNPSHRMPRYAEAGYPFISTVDFVGSEEIRRRTAKYVAEETYLEQKSRCSFAAGDVLYSRIGTIGQARLLTEVWPFALSHVLVVVKPKLGIEPRFLLWYLRSDSIISQADEATRSIGVPDLGIKRIREFHMPRPSIDEQRRIVAELDALQMQVDSLQDLQAETSAELDALMPSILDKAFRGKL